MEDEAHRLLDLLATLGRRNSLRDPVAQSVESMGLTPPQLHALMWLGADAPLTMGELAQRVGVTEKTITGIVDRLERDGFVQRDRGHVDRRVVQVRLTPQGQETAGHLRAQVLARTHGLLAALEADDRAALFRIVERLVARFASPEADAVGR
jgi:DNA-binding MarR family transcriptional regulator